MSSEIKPINVGGVNCFLVKTDTGFILIDSGFSSKRALLEKKLTNAGVMAGNLNLIILTHGDSDHTGNCAYLRDKYNTKIAMHHDDSGMVEHGSATWNRKAKPDKFSLWFRLVGLPGKSGNFDTFKPDIYIKEEQGLSEYGLEAKVIHIPGHSKGSIGILTIDGDLFCGDLMFNIFKPGLHPYIEDLAAAISSVEKLKKLDIKTVYPGHGMPFSKPRFKYPQIDTNNFFK